MIYFLAYIIVDILIWYGTSKKKRDNRVLKFSCIYLTLIMGLRGFDIGNDTYRYYLRFLQLQSINWESVFENQKNYGFIIFTKLIGSIVHDNFTIYLLIVAFICNISIYYFLKEHSESMLLSHIMLLSLGFVFFFTTGIKQTLAISILLFAYTALLNKKRIIFASLVLLASLFHSTALIFIIVWPLSVMKLKKSYIVIAPILVGLTYIYRNRIFLFMKIWAEDDYSAYGSIYNSQISLSGLFIQIMIFMVSYILLKSHFDEDSEISFMFAIYIVGMMFQSMTGILGEFFRLSMYFNIIGLILLPKAISKGFTDRSAVIARGVVEFVFIIYFIMFSSHNEFIIPYHFFFNT